MVTVRAFGDNVLCIDADFGDQVTNAGIILKSNIKKSQGITPRWFRVFSVGEEITAVKPGQWVLVQHGRWSESWEIQDDRFDTENKIKKMWKVDPKGLLAVSDERPDTLYYNKNVVGT